MTTYIYGLIDPRDERVRYVGKTRTPESRRREHLREMGNWGSTNAKIKLKREWAKELRDQGLEPEFVILEVAGDDWAEAERRWIQQLRDSGHPLINTFDGGQEGGRPRQKPPEKPFRWWSPNRGFYTPDSAGGEA